MIIEVALGLLVVGGAGFMWRVLRGPNLADRVVALDGLLTIVVTAFVAYGALNSVSTYLMVSVVVALVAFLGASMFARHLEGSAP